LCGIVSRRKFVKREDVERDGIAVTFHVFLFARSADRDGRGDATFRTEFCTIRLRLQWLHVASEGASGFEPNSLRASVPPCLRASDVPVNHFETFY
jgi:hypothetical protein